MTKDDKEKLESLMEYMESEFGVTPENIDQKLKELREEYMGRLENE